jgi:hypothetical protein
MRQLGVVAVPSANPMLASLCQNPALTAAAGRGSLYLVESPKLEKEPRLAGAV